VTLIKWRCVNTLPSFILHWLIQFKNRTNGLNSFLFQLGFQSHRIPPNQGFLERKKNTVRTKTNRNKICFGCVSVCFVKPNTKIFGLFQFVSVFRTYIETTETNRTVSNQTETTLNFLSLSNCFGWSSVCFGSIETSKLAVSKLVSV
jgi:hypothetical protein